jgi:hypothetical protein
MSDKLKKKLEKRSREIEATIGKQNVMPNKVAKQKRFNRYREGEKVTVVAEQYRTAIITKVWIRHGKITYSAKCGDGVVLNKLPEDAFLPHVKKWQYRLIQWLGNKLGINIVTT